MFIKEDQYEISKENVDFGISFFLKIIFRIFLFFLIVFFIHKYIKYQDSIYETKAGDQIFIDKSYVQNDFLISNNIEDEFYNNSDCTTDNTNNNYCNLKSSEIFNVKFKDDKVFLRYKTYKEIYVCTIKINCLVTFNHNDLIINKI